MTPDIKPENPRAFARAGAMNTTNGSASDGDHFEDSQDGMTLRDYFAAKALQGLLSNPPLFDRATDADYPHEWYSQQAYEYADAMLKARQL